MRTTRLVFLLAATAVPAVAAAQEHPLPDSLDIEVRRLRARVDSLERLIQQLVREGRDTVRAGDELAALRRAAQEAAGRAEPPDTADQQSRTRSLQALNPEISVTGDIVGNYTAPAGEAGAASAAAREFEFAFQAPLDPYTRTKVFITRHEDFAIAGLEALHAHDGEAGEEDHGQGFEIEEGYLYWVGLPGGLGAKIGKFRQEIGLYNRWHTHALNEIDRPLAATTFLGEDGLIQTGLAVTLPTLTLGPATQTLVFQATRGSNGALFAEGSEPAFLGRFQSFWDLSTTSYLQLGATGVVGENDEVGLASRLLALDVAFRWTPPQARFHDFQLKSEWYVSEREIGGLLETAQGGYAQANYRLDRRWVVGARADYVEGFGSVPAIVQVAPTITWWQSEWVRLRLQYNYVKPEGFDASHTVLVQAVWAAGPHKHETY
ncbi:MAG: hypothetical protein PVF27_01565 [Gemmatimonadales bacterium]|jgi:hypothetical protein